MKLSLSWPTSQRFRLPPDPSRPAVERGREGHHGVVAVIFFLSLVDVVGTNDGVREIDIVESGVECVEVSPFNYQVENPENVIVCFTYYIRKSRFDTESSCKYISVLRVFSYLCLPEYRSVRVLEVECCLPLGETGAGGSECVCMHYLRANALAVAYASRHVYVTSRRGRERHALVGKMGVESHRLRKG